MAKVCTHGGQNITSDFLQTGPPSDHPKRNCPPSLGMWLTQRTVGLEIFASIISRKFENTKFRENRILAKSFCRLLLLVYHAIDAIFFVQICLLMLFAKIKFSRKFPDLQYSITTLSDQQLNMA